MVIYTDPVKLIKSIVYESWGKKGKTDYKPDEIVWALHKVTLPVLRNTILFQRGRRRNRMPSHTRIDVGWPVFVVPHAPSGQTQGDKLWELYLELDRILIINRRDGYQDCHTIEYMENCPPAPNVKWPYREHTLGVICWYEMSKR